MYEKRGEQSKPVNEKQSPTSQTDILVVVNLTYRQTVKDMLHRYGYSEGDYSVAPDTITAKKMLPGKKIVIKDDSSAIAMGANGSIVVRADAKDFSEQLSSALESKVKLHSRQKEYRTQERKKRVLVVDVDNNYLTLCKQTLGNLGYEVSTVDNSDGEIEENAIYEIGETGVDLVILNYELDNDVGGLRLLLILKQFFPDIPIILQTKYDDNKARENAKNRGVYATIGKSNNLTELTDSVAEALGQKGLSPLSDGTIDRLAEEVEESETDEPFHLAEKVPLSDAEEVTERLEATLGSKVVVKKLVLPN